MSAHKGYEVVIGLEVHVQLGTRSKLFCSAPVLEGAAPNAHVSELCLALPGALPVLNGRAVELAVRAGLATHCTVNERSLFARKNYFYPDLPKGYQVSQYEEPLCSDGHIEIKSEAGEKRIGITRIHIEEDAGKLLHEQERVSRVDLNRAGVPLVEVVFEPDMRSPEEAVATLRALREILRYIGSSDCDMEKGQFRCDANVSLRRPGASELGTRREIKNLNSFRYVADALRCEIEQQAELLDAGGAVEQATVGYNVQAGRTFVMRTKENADDYRYFPDPDLAPLKLSPQFIEDIRAALPELPGARRERFQREFGLSESTARVLTAQRALADWFEAALRAGGPPAPLANWTARDVLGLLSAKEAQASELRLAPEHFAALVGMVESGRLTARNGRDLLAELLFAGGDPEALVRERGLEAVTGGDQLEAQVRAALEENPKARASYASGDAKALNFLIGKVMQATHGKADPVRVRELLLAGLER